MMWMKWIALFLMLLMCGVASATTTYYMATDGNDTTGDGSSGNEWLTLDHSMDTMNGGDTLIIRDGTYTGDSNRISSANKIPIGDATNYTFIQAENNGMVTFDGEDTRNMCDLEASSYFQLEGLQWGNSPISICKVGSGTEPHHGKFIRCGVFDGGDGDTGDGFVVSYAHHLLFEECYAYGNTRYSFYMGYNAEQIIVRRCVARIDSHLNYSGVAGFLMYKPDEEIEFQNCIAIDIDNNQSYYTKSSVPGDYVRPRSYYVRNDNQLMANMSIRGCIALNNQRGMQMIDSGDDPDGVHFENCTFWDSYEGARADRNNVDFDHCTIGVIDGPDGTTTGSGIRITSGESVTNTIFYGVTNNSGLDASVASCAASDYNCFYNNTNNDCSSNTYDFSSENANAIDPIDGTPGNGTTALKYLPRIENGSDIDGAGSGGSDIGATILYKIGVDGTLWGESGYNEATSESLWPFPSEDLIKNQMKVYTADGGNLTGYGGFCANGTGIYGGNITLTSYIWEYLGHACPSDIYGNGFSPDHSKAYYNTSSSIVNTVNSTGYVLHSRTPTENDGEISSFELVVIT